MLKRDPFARRPPQTAVRVLPIDYGRAILTLMASVLAERGAAWTDLSLVLWLQHCCRRLGRRVAGAGLARFWAAVFLR